MPALPDVPNVVKIVHTGTVDVQPWAGVSHWRYVTTSGDLTSAQLTLICAKFVNAWRDNIAHACGDNVIDQQVEGIDLTTPSSAVGIAPDGNAGTQGTGAISPASCVLVTKPIGRRYRGGHPRTYWAGLASQFSTSDIGRSIDGGHFSAIQSNFLAYYADIPPAVTTDADTNVSSWREVSVSYHSGGVLRTTPVVDDITGYNVHQVLATQRRRMHRA